MRADFALAYNENHSQEWRLNLSDLNAGDTATVLDVADAQPNDPIARRLRELGFVAGESVRVLTRAPFGGDPLLVFVGSTRFALRRSEAARIAVARA